MAEISISQAEADALLAMAKQYAQEEECTFPQPGERVSIPLTSTDRRENFSLDISRSQIRLTKATYQNRARQVIILLRLDLDGRPHRNPDGEEIPCPHLHFYREGYGDKWAVPAPPERYSQTQDFYATLDVFISQCNITKAPRINRGLF